MRKSFLLGELRMYEYMIKIFTNVDQMSKPLDYHKVLTVLIWLFFFC